MDVISSLQALGFTEYEARVYCALVRFPGSTGYEIGGQSKVPRARVYEVLEGLQQKGVVYAQTTGGKHLYYPKPHKTMLEDLKHEMEQIADTTLDLLDSTAVESPQPEFLVFTGEKHIFSKFAQMCKEAKVKLIISGWPEELTALAQELKDACDRGVEVYAVCFGEAKLPIPNVFYHTVSPLQYVQVAVFGRWLLMVADLNECFIGQMLGPDKSLALWTQSPMLSFTAAQWIYHDITVLVYQDALGTTVLNGIDGESHRFLRRILEWPYDDPNSQIKLPEGAPSIAEIFEGIERRFKTNPNFARRFEGRYLFNLSGEGGDSFHVIKEMGIVQIGRGAVPKPHLVFEASCDDFRAVVLGVLPLGALYTPNRIKVHGDIRAASQIQGLLRG